MDTLTKSLDPDEMQHNMASRQCLHCLVRRKQSSKKDSNLRLLKIYDVFPVFVVSN